MIRIILLAVMLCCYSPALANPPEVQNKPDPSQTHQTKPDKTCTQLIDEIKQMTSGQSRELLDRLDRIEQSGCIDEIGIKSFYWNRGKLRSELNDHRGALDDLSRLIGQDISPKDKASALSLKGFSLMSLKQYDAAEADFIQALELRPKLKKTLMLLATTRLFKDDRQGASQAIEQVKAINPHDPKLLLEVARFYFDFSYFQEAIRILKEYLSFEPEDYKALFMVGMAHVSKKDYQNSFHWFIRSFTANPDYVVALNNAIASLVQEKKYDQAIETVFQHTKKRSEIDILKVRAYTYEAAGWCADAAHWYKEIARFSSMKTAPRFLEKAEVLLQECPPDLKQEKDVKKYDPAG